MKKTSRLSPIASLPLVLSFVAAASVPLLSGCPERCVSSYGGTDSLLFDAKIDGFKNMPECPGVDGCRVLAEAELSFSDGSFETVTLSFGKRQRYFIREASFGDDGNVDVDFHDPTADLISSTRQIVSGRLKLELIAVNSLDGFTRTGRCFASGEITSFAKAADFLIPADQAQACFSAERDFVKATVDLVPSSDCPI